MKKIISVILLSIFPLLAFATDDKHSYTHIRVNNSSWFAITVEIKGPEDKNQSPSSKYNRLRNNSSLPFAAGESWNMYSIPSNARLEIRQFLGGNPLIHKATNFGKKRSWCYIITGSAGLGQWKHC